MPLTSWHAAYCQTNSVQRVVYIRRLSSAATSVSLYLAVVGVHIREFHSIRTAFVQIPRTSRTPPSEKTFSTGSSIALRLFEVRELSEF